MSFYLHVVKDTLESAATLPVLDCGAVDVVRDDHGLEEDAIGIVRNGAPLVLPVLGHRDEEVPRQERAHAQEVEDEVDEALGVRRGIHLELAGAVRVGDRVCGSVPLALGLG